eukprot:g55905.t1
MSDKSINKAFEHFNEQLNRRTKEFLQDLAKQSATVAATDAQESDDDDFVSPSQLAEQESTQPLGSLFGASHAVASGSGKASLPENPSDMRTRTREHSTTWFDEPP